MRSAACRGFQRMASKEDDYEDEGKYGGKYDDDDDDEGKAAEAADDEEEFVLPGMGQTEEDTILIRVVKYCSSEGFTRDMNEFVSRNCKAWEHADISSTGEGASHEDLAQWRRIHEEYMELFEEKLERFVRRQEGDLAELMADCRTALENKYGWLFEDENYAGFVRWMKSVLVSIHQNSSCCYLMNVKAQLFSLPAGLRILP